ISAGQLQASTTLETIDDSTYEYLETIIVEITSISGGGATENGNQQQTVFIADDESSQITLNVSSTTVAEAAGTIVITASMSRPFLSSNGTIYLGFSGTATKDTDYSASQTYIDIGYGQTVGAVTLTTMPDALVEGDESIIVTVINTVNIIKNGFLKQTLTISDDDNANVTLTASPTSLAEAAASSTITATLDKPSFEDITVNLGYTGTATNGTDYAFNNGMAPPSITVLAGQTTGAATVTTTQDALFEPDESIIVDVTSISGGRGAQLTEQQQTLSIVDDDSTTVSLTLSATSMNETSGSSTLTATLSQASFENIVVDLGYTGTATNGTDYTFNNGAAPANITIPAGQTSAAVVLNATSDTALEPGETIIIDITSLTGSRAVISSSAQQTLTIIDDDVTNVSLSVNNSTVSEAAGSSTITATLDSATYADVTINLGVSGAAVNNSDYTMASSVTITAGQTTGLVILNASQDTQVEGDESVIVYIDSVNGGSAFENGTQQQTVTISDDDNANVSLTANTATLAESAATATISATLDKPSFADIIVNLDYTGTATNGTDYAGTLTSITILAGQTTGSATLSATQDTLFEPNESIIVNVSSVTGGRGIELNQQQQTLTIIDDDTISVSLSASASELTEAGGSRTLTAILSQPSFENIVVDLGYSGTAINGTDYTFNKGTAPANITIPAGQTRAAIELNATDNNALEGNKTIIVDITNVTGERAGESGIAQQTLTIIDDEFTNVTLTTTTDVIDENEGSATITVTLAQPTFEDVIVELIYSGSAHSIIDYAINNGLGADSITIVKGKTTASTTITALPDSIVEDNETIIVDINKLSGGNAVELVQQQQTITIVDDSDVFVTLSTSSTSIAEASEHTTLTVNLNQVSIDDVTVDLRFYGKAVNDQDYSVDSNSITITAGQISANTTLTATQDNDVESAEVIIVDIFNVTGGRSVEQGEQQISIMIIDDDIVTVSLSVDTDVIDEASGLSFITATIDRPVAANVTVNLGYSGTAIIGTDYQTTDNTIVIEPGKTTQSTLLMAQQDTTKEGAETVFIDITSAIGVNADTSGATTQTITITDDDEVGPAGYGVTIDVSHISSQNHLAFTINHAQVGDTYHYSVKSSVKDTDTENADITGVGQVSLSEQKVGNIDVARLVDGLITLTVTLTDAQGNVGSPTSASVIKHTAAPVIANLSPRNNDKTVTIRSTLILMFDKAVSAGTVDNLINVKSLATSVVVASIATDSDAVVITGNHVEVTLPQDLPHSSAYYVTIDKSAFFDQFGNPYGGFNDTTTWHFSTANPNLITNNDTVTLFEDNRVAIAVLYNDVSLDSSLNPASVMLNTFPSRGTTRIDTANGVITYQPEADFNGSERFTYQVMDLMGNTSAPTTIDIRIKQVNDAPQAHNDTAEVVVNGSVAIAVLANDIDVDGKDEIDPNSLTATAQPEHGQITLSEGTIIYLHNAGFQGSDQFDYTVSDKAGAVSNVATVSVNVAGSNIAPATTDDIISVNEDETVSISVLDNDQNIDGQLISASVAIASLPQNGTAQVQTDGTINYTPKLNTFGQDQFSYTVKDLNDARSLATVVTVNVISVNDAPIADDDIAVITEAVPYSINVMGNDHDSDNSITSVTILTQPEYGTATFDDHSELIVFTPGNDFAGTDSFTYQLTDSEGELSNVATVELTGVAVNSPPLTNNDSVQIGQDTSVSINVLANDSDIDGSLNQTSLKILSEPTQGFVVVQSNGDITYTPAPGFSGQDELVYQVSDDQGAVSSAKVSIVVNGVNQSGVRAD
ncbi:MAG: tandem-95 repeat protein, partial [Psychrosphaera sp.]|nr:tandem-95 repeat protein [Psychrosphaera sp.]